MRRRRRSFGTGPGSTRSSAISSGRGPGGEARRGEAEGGEMWVFYLISLPLTLGMVTVTLRYFAGPGVPRYVIATVGYAWFCSLSFIILVPADIWTVRSPTPLDRVPRPCMDSPQQFLCRCG